MRFCHVATFVAALLFGLAPPAAEAKNITADPPVVIKALNGLGYPAELGPEKLDEPYIIAKADDVEVYVYFYDCQNGRKCGSIMLSSVFDTTGIPVSTEKMNGWNEQRRFTRAYLDANGNAAIDMDVIMSGVGLDEKLFGEVVQTYLSLMFEFSGFVFYGDVMNPDDLPTPSEDAAADTVAL